MPRKRLDLPMTALRVTPSVFAIWAAVRPAACCANSRLSRDGVQLVVMAAPVICSEPRAPPARRATTTALRRGYLTPVTRINGKDQGDKVADVPVSSGHGGTGTSGERRARPAVPWYRGSAGTTRST